MINVIIDRLFLIDQLGNYVPSIIQLAILFVWILLTRKSSRRVQMSLMITLLLLSISIIALVLTLKSVSDTVGVYAFLFLGIGMVQSIFSD